MSGRRAITLVARREIRERLRSKVFLVSTLVMLLIVGGSTALQGALSKKPTYHVAVTAPAPAGLAAALERAAKPFDDAKVRLRVVASPAAGRRALEAEQVDALLLLSQDRLVFRTNVDAKAAAIADTAVRALRNHLPPAPELTTATLHPPDAKTTDAADARRVRSARCSCSRPSRSTASGWSAAWSRRRTTASSRSSSRRCGRGTCSPAR